jgi:chromosome segregation ATPase
MNAVMRKPYEAPVIPNETIEANITFLRTNVDEVKADMRGLQADNRSLRDKIDTVRSELIHRIEQVRDELLDKIDQVRVELGARIDGVSTDQKAGDEKIGAKIDLLAEKLSETNIAVAKVATLQKAMFWVIGGLLSLAVLVEMVIRAGEKYHWF